MLHKMKRYSGLWLALLVVLLMVGSAVVAQDDDGRPEPKGRRWDSPQYALHGPYWTGARDIEVMNGDRLLRGNIWYPALNPDGAEYEDYA